MRTKRKIVALAMAMILALGSAGYPRESQAQWAVVDIFAQLQWPQQIAQMLEQVRLAQQYVQQAIFIYGAVSGVRHFGDLLMLATQLGVYRYFPPEYGGTMSGIADLGMLAIEFNRLMSQVSYLTGDSFGSSGSRQATMHLWQVTSIARQGAYGRTAYYQSSQRIPRFLELNARCGSSTEDIMGGVSCQNRLAAEQLLVTNDINMMTATRMIQEAEEREGKQKLLDTYYLMGMEGVPSAPFPSWGGF